MHEVVRAGALLLGSSNGWGPRQGYFNGAAVLLLKTCGCHSVLGVFLNQPTDDTMNSAFCPRTRARFARFASNPVRLGGPVGPAWASCSPAGVLGQSGRLGRPARQLAC